MGSVISGYNYDIFISYRQKDNKHDGWVTRFIENLKGELESTFKEDISIYFDENPHDRLQETHDVDKSLEGKLKCLIFIPVLSQTYCDPNSYAWKYEFLAFLKAVKDDPFGKDVKLRGGNFASRILPIKIHDLESEDVKLFEKETGGVLRAMDLVYKTATGVNRPLRSNEDRPNDNLNKTSYLDQINKVAGAIKEIILSMKKDSESAVQGKIEKRVEEVQSSVSIEKDSKRRITLQSGKWLVFTLSLLLVTVVVILLFSILNHSKQSQKLTELDKSIAVLPFANDSPDIGNEYVCNGMMEEILNQLQKISDLRVKSRTSSEKYRDSRKDVREIGKELEVAMIMEGSVRKVGDDLRIYTQLINAKTGDHLWSEVYDGKYSTDILSFLPQVARKVANSLNAVIKPTEIKSIEAKSTTDIAAHDLWMRGSETLREYRYQPDTALFRLAINQFDQALRIDPHYIDAFRGKAMTFAEAGLYDSALYYHKKANKIDPDHMASLAGTGVVYFYSNQPDSAFKYLQMAVSENQYEPWGNLALGQSFLMFRKDAVKALFYMKKAYDLGGDSESEICRNIAMAYYFCGENKKAVKYYEQALRLRSEFEFVACHNLILAEDGKFIEANNFLDSIWRISAFGPKCDILKFYFSVIQKDFVTAEKHFLKAEREGYKITNDDAVYLAYLYKETGRKEKAFATLNNLIPADLELLKKGTFGWSWRLIKSRMAATHSILGNKERSLEYLKEVGNSGIFSIYFNVNTFPGFDNLRNDPEFKSIVKRIKNEKDSLRVQVREMELKGEENL